MGLEESKQVLYQEVFWKGYFILKSVKTGQVRTLSMESQQGSPQVTKDRCHILECIFQFSAVWQNKAMFQSQLLFFHFIFRQLSVLLVGFPTNNVTRVEDFIHLNCSSYL